MTVLFYFFGGGGGGKVIISTASFNNPTLSVSSFAEQGFTDTMPSRNPFAFEKGGTPECISLM